MGMLSEISAALDHAIREMREHKENTLGWYFGVMLWNDAIAKCDDDSINELKYKIEPIVGDLPETTWEGELLDYCWIATPNYDKHQELRVLPAPVSIEDCEEAE